MQSRAVYSDLHGEVERELTAALERARAAGIPEDRVALDPGLGFAKTGAHNLTLRSEGVPHESRYVPPAANSQACHRYDHSLALLENSQTEEIQRRRARVFTALSAAWQ